MIFWVSSILKVNLDHFNGQNTPKNPGVDIKIVTLHDLAAKLFHFLILPVMADVGHYDHKYWYYPINFEVIFGKNVGI